MTSDSVWQVVRYLLIAAGSFATGKGWVTSDQVTSVIGALGTLFTVAWGFYVKFGTHATTAKTAARTDVPVVCAAIGIIHCQQQEFSCENLSPPWRSSRGLRSRPVRPRRCRR
jgi:hypothetical protein